MPSWTLVLACIALAALLATWHALLVPVHHGRRAGIRLGLLHAGQRRAGREVAT